MPATTARLAQRLLILGWDAADWKIIDPLLADGAMPNLARLIRAGSRADLASLDPKLSPLLWTSIATGKTADKHGILNFLEPDPSGAGVRLSSSCTRRTKALWNILTQRGLTSLAVNWYASHPAEPIRGAAVSNVFQEAPPAPPDPTWPLTLGSVHPEQLRDAIASARVNPARVTRADLLALGAPLGQLPDDDRRWRLLRRLVAQMRSTQNVAVQLVKSVPDWACAMVFFDAIDVAGHHFMQFHPPRMAHVSKRDFAALSGVVNGFYRLQDRMLGELLAAAGGGLTVMLVSDHGFHSDHLRPPIETAVDDEHAAMDATWHRPYGILALSGPGVKADATIGGANLLDIAPTALALLGVPVGADMDGRVLTEALTQPLDSQRVPSWDTEPGEAGQHPAELRVDPFDARDAMRQLADLGYIASAGASDEQALEMVDRETRSNLGIVYMTTGRPLEALPIFERLHAEKPDQQRFAMNLSRCLNDLGRVAEAEATLRAFLAANPNAPDAGRLHAGMLIVQRRFDDAARVLEGLVASQPNQPDVLSLLADVCTAANRLDDADRAARQCLAIDRHHAPAHHALARTALLREAFEPAAEHALDALELRQGYPEAHHTLGVALAWLGDLDHAAQSFRLALSLQPGMIESHRFLAAILEQTGDTVAAQTHRDTADTLDARAAQQNMQQPLAGESPLMAETWKRSTSKA